jgi:hypothetical protein
MTITAARAPMLVDCDTLVDALTASAVRGAS